MNTISLHLEIDPANVKVAQALSNLILVMGGSTTSSVAAQETIKKEKTTKETFKAPTEEKIEEPAQSLDTAVVEGIPVVTEENDGPTVTLQEVREALGPKVEAFRVEIKTKLTACDNAQNVGKLDPKYYAEFLDFLNGLK